MPLPTITEEDLANVDLSKPLDVNRSPIAREDPERAALLQQKMGNPVEVQQLTTAEFRVVLEQRQAKDMAELGYISDSTLKWMAEMNKQLSELHHNLYGTKSMQVSVSGKITHAQIASLMRESDSKNIVVDVVPDGSGDT